MRILFIGNSHTYVNEMPALVMDYAKRDGVDCSVTMLAHGGWFLRQHVSGDEAAFNILHGGYDYVVLQEHTHPFASQEEYLPAVRQLCQWIRQAGAVPVIYATWARQDEPQLQPTLDALQAQAAVQNEALLAPVGALWQQFRLEHPEVQMYAADGAHASLRGSQLAAEVIWDTIHTHAQGEKA